jgi:hypothetical protein
VSVDDTYVHLDQSDQAVLWDKIVCQSVSTIPCGVFRGAVYSNSGYKLFSGTISVQNSNTLHLRSVRG